MAAHHCPRWRIHISGLPAGVQTWRRDAKLASTRNGMTTPSMGRKVLVSGMLLAGLVVAGCGGKGDAAAGDPAGGEGGPPGGGMPPLPVETVTLKLQPLDAGLQTVGSLR